MKCNKCGHRANSIAGMAKHYRKAHPGSMKHRSPRKTQGKAPVAHNPKGSYKFCPHCGGFLG